MFAPATQAVSDPFGAAAAGSPATLQILPGAAAADPAGAVLRGLLAAACFGLTPTHAFQVLKRHTLAAAPPDAASAQSLSAAFVPLLAALAAVETPYAINGLLGTALLEASLSSVYGGSVKQAAVKFPRLRARADASVSDGAVWLAAMLGKVIRQGKTGVNLTSDDPFVAWQAQAAFAQARQILQSN